MLQGTGVAGSKHCTDAGEWDLGKKSWKIAGDLGPSG
jgi:hypothetical protein